MAYDLQFVDSIAATPGVRLNLNAPGWTVREDTEFGMPELRRSVVSTLLVDGDRYPAAAYGGRVLSLVLRVDAASDDDVAGQLQRLYRELDRPTNILRYRPGTSQPVFFRTFRAGPDSVIWDPFTKEARVQVPAEPFAYGLKETLPAVTVYNDPAEGTNLNANAYFETAQLEGGFEVDLAGWTGVNASVARSTAQSHAGVASALVTPSGSGVVARVEADMTTALPATPGQSFTAEAWVRPTNGTKPAAVQITWRDSSGGFISSTVSTTAATAGAWQFLTVTATCPVGAAFAQPAAGIGSTPTVADTAYVDELRLLTVSPWTAVGGTIARSTAQAHEGVASLLLTPDGVTASVEARSETVSATAGQQFRSSAWVRCAAARSVFVGIIWRDSGGTLLTTVGSTVSVSATTWTLIDTGALTAPANAASAQIIVAMGSTPPAGHTLHIDEARLRQAGGVGGMSFDVTSPKGDVEAPLFLSVRASDVSRPPESGNTGRRQSVFAVRRGGTPSAAPVVLQSDSLTAGTDTTVQAASGSSSGTFLRTSFATATSLQQRATLVGQFPSAASTDARGTYRVFLRCRKSVSGDTMQLQMRYDNSAASVTSDLVAGPADTVWRWVDMGLVQMPLGYDPATDGLSGVSLPVGGMGVTLLAARTSGSGTLDLDVVMFVPADDRLSLVKWPDYTTETAYVVDAAAGQAYGVGSSGEVRAALLELIGGTPMVTPGVANRIWMLRDVGSTYSNGDDVTATVQVTPYYWPRYLHMRPVAS